MRIVPQLTDEAVLAELGLRLERRRIDAALTQAALAREAGIAKRTLERIESGSGCELATLVRVLRVLQLVDELDALVPEPVASPVALLEMQGRQRRRVRSAPGGRKGVRRQAAKEGEPAPSGSSWNWGE